MNICCKKRWKEIAKKGLKVKFFWCTKCEERRHVTSEQIEELTKKKVKNE